MRAFERLAVVGMGLLGGSVGLAARKHGAARQIRGVDPKLRGAQEIPLVSLREAAVWAELIVLAVPVEARFIVVSRGTAMSEVMTSPHHQPPQ